MEKTPTLGEERFEGQAAGGTHEHSLIQTRRGQDTLTHTPGG